MKVRHNNLDANLTENYGYDDINRLTSASSGVYGSKIYSYDQLNNILQKDGRNYQYDPAKPYTLTNDGRYAYTYDANGSMTGRSDGRIISWDYENRVSSTAGENYYYNSVWQRIKKTDTNGVSKYYFFPEYEEEYNGETRTNAVKYYFANTLRVAESTTANGVRYYTADYLGSSTVISDASGNLVLGMAYQPYGSVAYQQGAASVPYKFTGKETDQTGYSDFGARLYDSEIGRFISVDPAQDGDNWYAYCSGNPINRTDPDGLREWIDGRPGTDSEFSLINDKNSQSGYHIVHGGNEYPNFVSQAVANTLYTGDTRYLDRALKSLQRVSNNNTISAGFILNEVKAYTNPNFNRNLGIILSAFLVSPLFNKDNESPALKGGPYSPESVANRNKPPYEPNPAHDAFDPLGRFNPNKTPEPSDAARVYNTASVRSGMGTWYGVNSNGRVYRYFSDGVGKVHFSGIIPTAQVPKDIRNQLGIR